LTILGSGTCELRRERSSPAYLVEAGGQAIMLDLGQGAWRRLMQAERDPARVRAILISHLHPDHVADLIPLLFALNYDPHLKAHARMLLAGHPDLQSLLEGVADIWGRWVRPAEENLATHWLSPGYELKLGEVTVSTSAAGHTRANLAYRLEHQGASLVYLGDSESTPQLVDLCRGADLVIAHCGGSDRKPKQGHLHPSAAGKLAQAAGAKSLLLSHLYRDVDAQEAQTGAAAHFSGQVWLAEDLMAWQISPGGAQMA
jgi:ribonuclease BN (tRNA processing enzyme)